MGAVRENFRSLPTFQLLNQGFDSEEERAFFDAEHQGQSNDAKKWAKHGCLKGCSEGMITRTFPNGGEGPIPGLKLGKGGSLRIWCDCASVRFAHYKRDWRRAYRLMAAIARAQELWGHEGAAWYQDVVGSGLKLDNGRRIVLLEKRCGVGLERAGARVLGWLAETFDEAFEAAANATIRRIPGGREAWEAADAEAQPPA